MRHNATATTRAIEAANRPAARHDLSANLERTAARLATWKEAQRRKMLEDAERQAYIIDARRGAR